MGTRTVYLRLLNKIYKFPENFKKTTAFFFIREIIYAVRTKEPGFVQMCCCQLKWQIRHQVFDISLNVDMRSTDVIFFFYINYFQFHYTSNILSVKPTLLRNTVNVLNRTTQTLKTCLKDFRNALHFIQTFLKKVFQTFSRRLLQVSAVWRISVSRIHKRHVWSERIRNYYAENVHPFNK